MILLQDVVVAKIIPKQNSIKLGLVGCTVKEKKNILLSLWRKISPADSVSKSYDNNFITLPFYFGYTTRMK